MYMKNVHQYNWQSPAPGVSFSPNAMYYIFIDEHNPAGWPKDLMFYPVARDLTVFISRPPPSSIPNKSDRVGREEGQACF